MNYTVRALNLKDEPIVWEILRYASHEPSLESVKNQPCLTRYAANWGRVGDIGWVAVMDEESSIGAAWLRLWLDDKGFGYIDNAIPELAMAVLPNYQGKGIGTHLLTQLLDTAKKHFPAVSLNVRANNPVVKLYERLGFTKVPESEVVNRTGGISFNMICEFESSL
jgi:ribosomal protein S18 acetylase RimI-like enzyme